MNLDFCGGTQMGGLEFGVNSIHPWTQTCLVSAVRGWWWNIGTLWAPLPINHFNAPAYVSIVPVHVNPFIAKISLNSSLRTKAKVISNWFHAHDNEFSVL